MGDNGSLIKITALVTEFVVKQTVIQFFSLNLIIYVYHFITNVLHELLRTLLGCCDNTF